MDAATAIQAGGMLVFALPLDEFIVTPITAGHQPTLPICFHSGPFRPRN